MLPETQNDKRNKNIHETKRQIIQIRSYQIRGHPQMHLVWEVADFLHIF